MSTYHSAEDEDDISSIKSRNFNDSKSKLSIIEDHINLENKDSILIDNDTNSIDGSLVSKPTSNKKNI